MNANKIINGDKFEIVRGKYLCKIINCPKPDQYVAVSCTASPVTQVAEVAVKMASKKEAPFPSLVAKGSISIKLPAKITSKNPNIII